MLIRMTKQKNGCDRCGTCCLKGGPVLHHDDKSILREGHAGHQHLVTIRKGELAYDPVYGKVRQVQKELVRVIGKDDVCSCVFYEEKNAECSVYRNRFLECRLLKCWDTSGLISVIGKNTIVRADIINVNDPVLEFIRLHEQECPVTEIQKLIAGLSSAGSRHGILSRIGEFVRRDQSMRVHALTELGIRKEYEFFIFGRPLTRLLEDHGLTVRNGENATTFDLAIQRSEKHGTPD